MWTPDMNRCVQCSKKVECEDRKKIIQTIQALTNDLNVNETADSPHGIIIIACQR